MDSRSVAMHPLSPEIRSESAARASAQRTPLRHRHTHCQNVADLDGTTLVFKTLRVSFPTAPVVVIDNASLLAVRPTIERLARETGCEYLQRDVVARHHDVHHRARTDYRQLRGLWRVQEEHFRARELRFNSVTLYDTADGPSATLTAVIRLPAPTSAGDARAGEAVDVLRLQAGGAEDPRICLSEPLDDLERRELDSL